MIDDESLGITRLLALIAPIAISVGNLLIKDSSSPNIHSTHCFVSQNSNKKASFPFSLLLENRADEAFFSAVLLICGIV
jgi:hypothetical protein